MADDLSAVGRFLYEAGTLKQTRRTGWWMAGVRDPESVAEHSWRTSLIATIIAKLEGADPARAAYLAVWHDTQESRTGDVNLLGKKYAPMRRPAGSHRRPDDRHARGTRLGGPRTGRGVRGEGVAGGGLRPGRGQAGVHAPGHRIQGPGLRERPALDRQQPRPPRHRDRQPPGRRTAGAGSLDWLRAALDEGNE